MCEDEEVLPFHILPDDRIRVVIDTDGHGYIEIEGTRNLRIDERRKQGIVRIDGNREASGREE
mgnify:CR=1 FL=1